MTRISTPRQALDFPDLPPETVIIWGGNEYVWPDPRRQTSYLTDKRTDAYGRALFASYASEAKQFDSVDAAATWLAKQSEKRGAPYHGVIVGTVAELIAARFPEA